MTTRTKTKTRVAELLSGLNLCGIVHGAFDRFVHSMAVCADSVCRPAGQVKSRQQRDSTNSSNRLSGSCALTDSVLDFALS